MFSFLVILSFSLNSRIWVDKRVTLWSVLRLQQVNTVYLWRHLLIQTVHRLLKHSGHTYFGFISKSFSLHFFSSLLNFFFILFAFDSRVFSLEQIAKRIRKE